MPRAGLSAGKVIAEAAALADEAGYDKLTLAAVAERTGVRLPSLYKHVASLDALRQGVAALATRELADTMTAAAIGRAGSDALRAALHGFLTLEAGGGFGMPHDIDRSYQRFITGFDTALSNWVGQPARAPSHASRLRLAGGASAFAPFTWVNIPHGDDESMGRAVRRIIA